MTQGQKNVRGWKLLAAIAAMGLPFGMTHAQPSPYQYDNYGAATAAPAQGDIDQDRSQLISARHHADDLVAQRDQLQQQIDGLRNGPASSAPTTTQTGDVKSLQQRFDTAKAKADKIHTAAVARFEQSDAWKAEFAKFDQARKDLKAPTDAVLNQLGQTQEFKGLVAAAHAAKDKADKLHEDKTADPRAVKDADAAFTAADNRVQDAAEKALSADPKVVDGRKLVDAAKSRLDQLRDRFEQDLIDDPAFGPAVAEVKSAREALDAANGQPAAEVAVAPLALNMNDAQAKLNDLNQQIDQARQDVDQLTDRVRQDEDAMDGMAQAPQPSPELEPEAPAYGAPAYNGYQPAYGYDYGYGYDPTAYGYGYGVPVYDPLAAYDSYDYWSPGLYFGFSFGSDYFNHRHYDDWYGRWMRPYSYGGYNGYHGYNSSYNYGSGGRSYGRGYAGRGYTGSRGSTALGYYSGSRYGGASRSSASVGGAFDYRGSERRAVTAEAQPSAYRQRVQQRSTFGYTARPSYEQGFSQRTTPSARESSSFGFSSRSVPSYSRSFSQSPSFYAPSRQETSRYESSRSSSAFSPQSGFGRSNSFSSRGSSFGSRSESFSSRGGESHSSGGGGESSSHGGRSR